MAEKFYPLLLVLSRWGLCVRGQLGGDAGERLPDCAAKVYSIRRKQSLPYTMKSKS